MSSWQQQQQPFKSILETPRFFCLVHLSVVTVVDSSKVYKYDDDGLETEGETRFAQDWKILLSAQSVICSYLMPFKQQLAVFEF